MPVKTILEPFVTSLLQGNRTESQSLIDRELSGGREPGELYTELIWPSLKRVGEMYREGRISLATERMATRITRTLADQLQAHLPRPESINKRILIGCAEGEPDELSAQMCSDLFEAEGWDVYFLGSGVPNDEILSLTGKLRPDILLMFLTQKEGVESMQQLVELIRNIGSNPTMNVMVSGTVDREVKSLGKESKPDLIAKTAGEALAIATAAEPRVPVIRMDRAPRKRRRRRKVAPETAGAK